MAPKSDDDDEVISEVRPPIDNGEKVTARYACKTDALLSVTDFKVLLELKGSTDAKDRPGLDLVMVLDVSHSMKNEKRIEHLRSASKLVVRKLSSTDCLSLIKFNNRAIRLCPLRKMTLDAQCEIESFIDKLKPVGPTNMTLALQEAVQVLQGRKITEGRQVAIMFVAAGKPKHKDADGSQVIINDVPVYTFSLGEHTNHQVLQNIASRSKNGTFSIIKDDEEGNTAISNLSFAFSQCLDGLLSVVVQDLSLAITPIKGSSRIMNVSAGRYQTDKLQSEAPTTILFGDLYSKEIRNVLVDLVLEKVTSKDTNNVLEFSYSYKDPVTQKLFESHPMVVTVSRNDSELTKENPEVFMEEARKNIAAKMKQAREEADAKKYDDAKAIINDAQEILQNADVDKSHPKMKSLEGELAQFLKHLEESDNYDNRGRAFALATELCHELQRFATRGVPSELRLFKEANALPMVVASTQQDPVKANAEEVTVYLRQAIHCLEAIIEIINRK